MEPQLRRLEGPPVDVGHALLEAERRVEPVGVLTVGTRRQIDGARADGRRVLERGGDQRAAHALAVGSRVSHDVFDPGSPARRDLEGGQRQRTHDHAVLLRDEQRRGGVGHNTRQLLGCRRRSRAGQLRHEGGHRRHQVGVDRLGDPDRNHDVADSPRHIGCRTLS